MAHGRGNALYVVPLLALTLLLAGCPKRPATSVGSAPAPGVATVTPPAPTPSPTPAAPATPSSPPAAAVTPPSAPTPAPSAPTPAPAAPPTAAPTPPRPSEFAESPNLKDIHFDFDKYDIRPGDARILDANAAWLKQNAGNLVLIEGHCDERGTAEYNLALGERRAKSTMNYLVSQGVAANRITIISYGKERPLCTEHNEACWSQNRRAHHLVKAQ
jgi:peptidoglycan-associated lipoprotein